MLWVVAMLGVVVLLAGCGTANSGQTPDGDGSSSAGAGGGTSTSTNSSDEHSRAIAPIATQTLPTEGTADYQLGGSYDPPAGVTAVARDSSEFAAEGLYSICYVNGFQSQPQDADVWLEQYPELLLRVAEGADAGKPVVDANWPDEMIFDTSTDEKRVAIAAVIGETIAQCAKRGFDAVEFDNLDSWSRSSGALTLDDSIALASLLVDRASALGLAAGQKNSAELGARGRDEAGFAFAVAEECAAFDECDAYSDVYGSNVIDIEYTDEVDVDFADVCADPNRIPLTILRDRNLVTPDSPEYVYDAC
jgi:hypothetical protein